MKNINGLNNLSNQKIIQDIKLRESAKQLEGVFLQYFLQNCRADPCMLQNIFL